MPPESPSNNGSWIIQQLKDDVIIPKGIIGLWLVRSTEESLLS